MAKILVTDYSFGPGPSGVGYVVLRGRYKLEQFLLVTNTTTNEIIYNFAASGLGGSVAFEEDDFTTALFFEVDTSSQNDTDDLQIFVDQPEAPVTVAAKLYDPVEKVRVSNPQALIDTDFEYSLQATKWESVQLQNNIAGIYQKANEPAYQGSSIISISPASGGGSFSANNTVITRQENGRTGMTTVYSGNSGDNSIFFSFGGFTVNYLGQNYTSCYLGGNGYMLFGGSSSQYFNLQNPDQPNLPAIKFFAADMRAFWMGRRIIGSAPNRTMIVRWEGTTWGSGVGNSTGGAGNICELRFFEGDERVQVHYIACRNASYGGVNLTGALQDGPGPSSTFLTQWAGTNGPLPSNTASPYTVNYAVEASWGQAAAAGSLTVSVDTAPASPFTVGQPIILKDTQDPLYLDGAFLITSINSSTSFNIRTRSPNAYSGNQRTDYTALYTGGFFYGAAIPYNSIQGISGTRRARINFTQPHGLYLGSKIYVVDSTQSGADYIGAFTVDRVIGSTSIEYTIYGLTNFANSNTISSGSTIIYARNEGISQHRFFDGGVQINPSTNSPNAQIIRQTRKYMRYQSGKGIQFSTGVLFMPVYDVAQVEVDTSVYVPGTQNYIGFNITTDQEHGFAPPTDYRPGARVLLTGFRVSSGSNPYNGTFTVAGVIDRLTFRVEIPVTSLPTDLAPGGLSYVSVKAWNDSVVRSGMFDDQNGLFFEHDGQELYAVRRNSTTQLRGRLSISQNSPTVVGVGTEFKTQLKEGDYIVLKGSSYLVNNIVSDTSLTVTPDYKGTSISLQKAVKTEDYRVPQSRFNLDKLDGTGVYGYTFDPNKMQMVFIDYSWYGAGKVRWGMRTTDGSILYCHEERQNNVNTEAYMRSGNLPGRFEIQSLGKRGQIQSTLTTTSTALSILESDAQYLSDTGTLEINSEYIGYTKGAIVNGYLRSLNLTRNLGFRSSNASASIGDGWISVAQNCSPSLSHWGVSIIMDGRFDEDKSYLFTAKNNSTRSVGNNVRVPLVSLRLAPSVDYGIPGFFGVRNLINRSAIKLESLGVLTNGAFDIEVVLNPESAIFSNNANWRAAPNGSIAQYIDHSITTTGTFTSGDVIAAFLPDEGSSRFSSSTYELTSIRELGNSILGGPNVYPDGPDVITIFARNTTGQTRNISARFSWSESQG